MREVEGWNTLVRWEKRGEVRSGGCVHGMYIPCPRYVYTAGNPHRLSWINYERLPALAV